MGNEDTTFTDTNKVVLSLTSPLPLLCATTLQEITIHMMSDLINPRFLRIYPVPKPTLEEGEVLPPKPVPHTKAVLNRTDLATGLVEAATRTSSYLQLHTHPTKPRGNSSDPLNAALMTHQQPHLKRRIKKAEFSICALRSVQPP
jgi:hypothetical protein